LWIAVIYDLSNHFAPEAWLTLDSCYLIGWNQKIIAVILV